MRLEALFSKLYAYTFCRLRISWWMIPTWDAKNERLFKYKSFIEDIKFPPRHSSEKLKSFSRRKVSPLTWSIPYLSSVWKKKMFEKQKKSTMKSLPISRKLYSTLWCGLWGIWGWFWEAPVVGVGSVTSCRREHDVINQIAKGVIDLRKKLIYLLN